tara:strand:- start:3042 stop:4754 length:1713 start_codon:yes stop_codon:yes gene_type:complete
MPCETTVLKQGACPDCSSSDAYTLYTDGHSWCFSCATYHRNTSNLTHEGEYEAMQLNTNNNTVKPVSNLYPHIKNTVSSAISDRKISLKTCNKYNVTLELDSSDKIIKHLYPYYDKNNNQISTKVKVCATKTFYSQPEGTLNKAILFGQSLFSGGGKYVTVCEGELDAMSAYEMLGSKWPVVSVNSGAQSAYKNCKSNLEYLNSFDNIVLCFDGDDAGQKAAQKTASLFEPNKCKIVNLSAGDLKDANEYLMKGKREDFTMAWWNARQYTPAGILNLADMGEALYEEGHYKTCLYPFSGLNDKLYGIRTGELVTFTAGTGTGKSSVMREMMHYVLNNTSENIGVISLEENVRNTIFHLMSVEANARLYIREIREEFSREDLVAWQDATVGTRRFYAFDHFGSMRTDEILSRIRYMIKALDCKWIFLDHLSILVSGLEGEDERRNIDNLMTKLRSITEECNVALLLVSHLRRTSGDTGHEQGKEVSLAHLRGSQSIAQLSDAVVAMERDQQSDDDNISNTTTIRVLKNRYSGETGVACHLFFNKDTGRLQEVQSLGDNPHDGDDGDGDIVL